MRYDPFVRGAFPVGVRSVEASDAARRRPLPIEIWYPATDAHRGQDLRDPTRDTYEVLPGFPAVPQDAVRDAAPRPGSYPLVAFSHGFGGHRRQSTFLCSHLASHGYVVASVDHTGNTIADMVRFILLMQGQGGAAAPEPLQALGEFIVARPLDVAFMIDELLAGRLDGPGSLVDAERIGMTGHSFGGWTTLMMAARDRRVRAALPLAPAGGSMPWSVNPLKEALDFDWGRDVPTLFLVAERDSFLPLPGMHELLARTQSPKRMVVLRNADHMHFCDRVEEVHEMFRMMPPPGEFSDIAKCVRPIDELCPPEHAYRFTCGLGLAHMDAVLRGNEAAAQLLCGDLTAALAARGIAADAYGGAG